jgi:hypothetical protein
MITQSTYVCPVCDVTLELEDVRNGDVALFCTHSNCPSWVTKQEGAKSCTEQQAYDTLCRKVEFELTQNDRNE